MARKPVKQTAKNRQGRKPGRAGKGKFAKGGAPGPGRPRGSLNQIGAILKRDLLTAYQIKGGPEYLARLPDALLVGLLGRVLPREVAGKDDGATREPEVHVEIVQRVVALLDAAGQAGINPELPGLGRVIESRQVEPADLDGQD